MEVRTYEDLEELIPKIECEIEKSLDERRRLDLSIPKIQTIRLLNYCQEQIVGRAFDTNGQTVIDLNLLQVVAYGNFNSEEAQKLNQMMYFFDIARKLFKHEDWILNSIEENPEKAMERFEKEAFTSQEHFQGYKDSFKEKGRTYDEYKKFILENASSVKQTRETLLPRIKEEFCKSDLGMNVLRHEIDHGDFFQSPLYQERNEKQKQRHSLQNRLSLEKTEEVSKECAKANIELLEIETQVNPIIEIKALFFNYIKPDEWKKADYKKVKKEVLGYFLASYIETQYATKILDALVSQKWSTGEMDIETSKFLFQTVGKQSGSKEALEYIINPEQVNFEVASQILHQELPAWKQKFTENAIKATEAIGKAYKEDPSRLKEANKAKTFEEFIKLCKNE